MPEFYDGTNITKSYEKNYWFGGSIGTAFLNEDIEALQKSKESIEIFLSDVKKGKALLNNYVDGILTSINATAEVIDKLMSDASATGIYIRVATGTNTSFLKLIMANTKGVPINKSGYIGYFCIFYYAANPTDFDYKFSKLTTAMTSFPSFKGLF